MPSSMNALQGERNSSQPIFIAKVVVVVVVVCLCQSECRLWNYNNNNNDNEPCIWILLAVGQSVTQVMGGELLLWLTRLGAWFWSDKDRQPTKNSRGVNITLRPSLQHVWIGLKAYCYKIRANLKWKRVHKCPGEWLNTTGVLIHKHLFWL